MDLVRRHYDRQIQDLENQIDAATVRLNQQAWGHAPVNTQLAQARGDMRRQVAELYVNRDRELETEQALFMPSGGCRRGI